ncbi:cytochrome d ubiquinol oxidase subunit II [Vibrio gazogenes]|uniref:Cytochrome d ubiquinol oxidase subunit II n=1 Tax=Vibrio gazogenes DSM 21264 = NBRC 103151 TaxID=1123492 RepID=A0A1M5EZL3_VIBGA|nr:cytochrome d ubiquinol oxidase subunit II [Vibrio gazogenes]USP14756.1 cytochrome d ubiquinol oxidase subunit II [Vibrio gazogenes]SHF84659.1 cytochrome d ubiquinol oxidase subunit II [Vibrio gazogenes DSM 21264] [Vibrio gazogenes DSM 21264 = NBRC 103151]SJN55114.1 Cytochrome bd-II ubiquinol oxidase subunit 2 [Vibrio gazogenes]
MHFDLSVIWFAIIVFATLMYIVMDGFDLGIGILMPFVNNKKHKDVMVNSVAPVWDGNETWIVLGGAALFGAFPLAYSVIIEALTIPLTLMLIALIFRGVAFEFRFKAVANHLQFWDLSFMVGSIGTTFFQGIVVGAVIQGFDVENRVFVGGQLDWITPFPIFCGFALVATYALLGSTWLIMKTEGELQRSMFAFTHKALLAVVGALVMVSLWTPLEFPVIATRWFSTPNLFYLLPIPVITGLACLKMADAVKKHQERSPFVMALIIIILGFAGLGISIWPNIIPPNISIWEAAAPASSQRFMLYGAVSILPMILAYTFWSYSVFTGKVKEGEAYH